MTDTVRLFVNEQAVDVPAGTTVIEAVETVSADLAHSVRAGTAYITDGVGRSTGVSRTVSNGEILRIVRSAKR